MRRLGDYDEEYLRRQSAWGLVMKGLGVLLALGVLVTISGFAFGWFRAGVAVVSPDNVKAQWQFAYDYNESLTAIGTQWCSAKAAEDAETDPSAKSQRTSQRLAIEQNYARVAAVYDGRLDDAFRAKLVRPSDVPTRAPSLQQTIAAIGCA